MPKMDVYAGAGLYWDTYHAWTNRLASDYGPRRVAVFDMEMLWNPANASERARLLDFVGQCKPWKLRVPSSRSVANSPPFEVA